MCSRPPLASLVLALACCGLADLSRADDRPTHLAKSIRVETSQPGSLEAALGVRSMSGTLELTDGVDVGSLAVDFYRDGKKVRTESGFLGLGPEGAATRWEFVVQVIDLDVLPLKDGKPGHFRVISTLRSGSSAMTHKADIAKDIFPLGTVSGQGHFAPGASSVTEAPLSVLILNVRPDEKWDPGISSGGTIEETLRLNPRSDLLIVRFHADAG
jgi:hypothetical protein